MIFKLFITTSFIFICFLSPDPALAASLKVLEAKYKTYQQTENYNGMAKTLEEMLVSGYQTKERFRSLADIYFFKKQDQKGLNTWKKFANWAKKDAKVWETYSDVLIWKKRPKAGIKALEKAVLYSKDNQELQIKLAGVYEYNKKIVAAIMLWKKIVKKSNYSLEAGKKYVEFLLRNGRSPEASEIIDNLLLKHQNLGSAEFDLIALKTYVWSNRVVKAVPFLAKIDANQLPEKDLEYMFKLATYSGNLNQAEKILTRLGNLGKNVWDKRIEILIKAGRIDEARESVEEKIEDEEETIQLLTLLYETYRAQRNLEEEINTIEKLIILDWENPVWHDKLYNYYVYHQKYERGIDLFEDILDIEGQENHQRALFNLARLHLLIGSTDDFNDTIQKVTLFDYKQDKLYMQLKSLEIAGNKEGVFQTTKNILSNLKNEAPETILKRKQKDNPEAELEADHYLNTLKSLYWTAELTGQSEERQRYGRMAYETIKKRYEQFPTIKRLYEVIEIGRSFADQEEKEKDFLFAIEHFPEHYFYLHYYRFLMWEGRKAEGNKMFQKLTSETSSLREKKQTAEHTFGFIPLKVSTRLFKKLLKDDPGYIDGLKRLGQISLYSENFREAEFYFNKYLTRYAYDPEITFSLGEALYNQNKHFEAQDNFERVVSLLDHPGREAYENELMAIALMRLANPERAKEILQFAKRQTPDSVSISLNILEALVELRQWNEILQLIIKDNLEKADPKRVGVVKHAALFELRRIREDRALLNKLINNFPNDKEIISTKAFFHTALGEDIRALSLFKQASSLPPKNEELERDTIEMHKRYNSSAGIHYESSETPNDSSSTRADVYAKVMINETDGLLLKAFQYQGKQEIENGYSVTATDLTAQWFGNLSDFQRYSLMLHTQGGTGFEGAYSKTYFNVHGNLELFMNTPNHDSLGLIAADTHKTGYTIRGSYNNNPLRQMYDLSYSSQQHELKEFEETPALSVKETRTTLGINQSFLKFPHQLNLRAQQLNATVSGDETSLLTEKSQIDLRGDYNYFFDSEWQFSTGIFAGNDTKTKVESSGAEATLSFSGMNRSFSLGYSTIQEKGEQTTSTTTNISVHYQWVY